MPKKEPNYNLTTTFYAKWILPFVLIIIGISLILLFFPGMRFMKGKNYDNTKEELSFYVVTIDDSEKYIEVKSKVIYVETNKGSTICYKSTETIYNKSIPWYSDFRMNLGSMGTAGGIGLTVVGTFMLIVNTFTKISKVSSKKRNKLMENSNEKKDEEDDE